MTTYANLMLIFLTLILCVLLGFMFRPIYIKIKSKVGILLISKDLEDLEGLESVRIETKEGKLNSIKRNKIVKEIFGQDKNLDDLAKISMQCCPRHEADLQMLWYGQDGTKEFLEKWLEETKHCCRQNER